MTAGITSAWPILIAGWGSCSSQNSHGYSNVISNMALTKCTKCGVEYDKPLKFCRQCGARISETEALTQRFEPEPPSGLETGRIDAVQTGPTYEAPGQASPDYA